MIIFRYPKTRIKTMKYFSELLNYNHLPLTITIRLSLFIVFVVVFFTVPYYIFTNTLRLYTSSVEIVKKVRVPHPSTFIRGLTGAAGHGTKPLESISMWGVAPLFRIVPSPLTVLSPKELIPTVCWAFRGSKGELVIYLMKPTVVETISVEHLKPDKSKSAPKSFVVSGVLEDDNEIVILEDQYRADGPALQFFQVAYGIFHEIKFKVISNQGNKDYTCLYKIHLYSHKMAERNITMTLGKNLKRS